MTPITQVTKIAATISIKTSRGDLDHQQLQRPFGHASPALLGAFSRPRGVISPLHTVEVIGLNPV